MDKLSSTKTRIKKKYIKLWNGILIFGQKLKTQNYFN